MLESQYKTRACHRDTKESRAPLLTSPFLIPIHELLNTSIFNSDFVRHYQDYWAKWISFVWLNNHDDNEGVSSSTCLLHAILKPLQLNGNKSFLHQPLEKRRRSNHQPDFIYNMSLRFKCQWDLFCSGLTTIIITSTLQVIITTPLIRFWHFIHL